MHLETILHNYLLLYFYWPACGIHLPYPNHIRLRLDFMGALDLSKTNFRFFSLNSVTNREKEFDGK